MKALILNSGRGSRMGEMTATYPKCMTQLNNGETIVARQLRLLAEEGIREVVMTTGPFEELLKEHCLELGLPLDITFVPNPRYLETNYIYSIYCAKEYLDSDLILLHGDLVFEPEVLRQVISAVDSRSVMTTSSVLPLPEKDFKAVVKDGLVQKVGVEFFDSAMAAQALYGLKKKDWLLWLRRIEEFCESGRDNCYAEVAFNELMAINESGTSDVSGTNESESSDERYNTSSKLQIFALDVQKLLCREVDSPEDLNEVLGLLKGLPERNVYMCFAADIIHGGHISIIRKAQKLGRLTIGVLSDEAVASYKRMPLVPESERLVMFENIAGVDRVVLQKQLSYKENLETYRPDIVVHGDDWDRGFQRPIRDEVVQVLASYGGTLVEYPYSGDEKYRKIDARTRADLAMPDVRRGRLKRMLEAKGFVNCMEAHDGLTGLVVEKTVVYQNGGARQYDAIWISSLCDSTAKGKPDIELVDMTSRFRTIEDIAEVTTKPIIFDGDTGGRTEHFIYTVRSLERLGVSMVIIEDKIGLKKNSLFGTEVPQTQDSIEHFCEKISAGKRAQRTREFMICARIESLILDQGMEDALERAFAYVGAGADAVMIHSRRKDPSEVFTFLERFRAEDSQTPVVLVPTSFDCVTEEEWKDRGANVVIYANQLMRAQVPAIEKAAAMILEHHRAQECDEMLMPFSEIIRWIPEESD
ncbi:MAG: phosphoenolpyruvate mutase [Lachnospiraceae bacterium]|nr:phosphoenolpyruvate mutase [Lachnospiraceae bacterium]